MTDWYSNGKRVNSVPINDRGLQYGDGLFETIAIRDGQPRLWAYHMDRLRLGCDTLGFAIPGNEALRADVYQCVQKSPLSDGHGVVKIVLTAGIGRRGYGRSLGIDATILIGVFASAALSVNIYRDGVDTILCSARLGSGTALSGMKTLNRLEQVLASSEVLENGVFEGFTMDADDNVICGTMTNVFFVTNNNINTPTLDRCGVNGVMRRHIIATLQDNDIDVTFRSFTPSALADIDELFVSNSQFGVLPVRRCEDRHWAVGEMTRKTMALMADNGIGECRG